MTPTVTLPIDLTRVHAGVPENGVAFHGNAITIYVVTEGYGDRPPTVDSFRVDSSTGNYPVRISRP